MILSSRKLRTINVAELLDAGTSVEEVASLYGVTAGRIRQIRHEIDKNLKRWRRHDAQIRSMVECRASQNEISEQIGVSSRGVGLYMYRNNIIPVHLGPSIEKGGAVIDAAPSVSTTPHTRNSADTEPSNQHPEQVQV